MGIDDIELVFEMTQPLGSHNPEYECVKTDSFPFLKQDFEYYNPMQSDFLNAIAEQNWDGNVVVSSPTASGKTTVAEICMVLANHRGKKGIVLVPLRALAQEKYEDWTALEHTFFDKKVVILTGDYSQQVTDKQLEEADIIIMTSESLDHRTRFMHNNKWLMDVGMVVVDEAHLLSLGSRGDRLETCLMRFSKYNTNARLALLSATMPNVDDLKTWLSHITETNTVLVKSKYRPCKLDMQYEIYEELPWNRRGSWDENEKVRMGICLDMIREFPNDQFIVFTGGKRWGRDVREFFTRHGLNAEFISADDTNESRIRLVRDFKSGKIRVLISSSLLAYGLNLPARRVIVAHVKRGNMDIDTCDLIQMAGRAGRPRYDKEGTVYFLVPDSKDTKRHIARIEQGEKIVSQLSNVDNLLFHVVAEVYNKEIEDEETLRDWYSRSLACVQEGHITSDQAREVLHILEKYNMIKKKENSDRKYEVTNLGKVCAWMYHTPGDVYGWWRNFSRLFDLPHNMVSDYEIAWAIANVDTHQWDYVSKAEKGAVDGFINYLSQRSFDVEGGVSKWGVCIYNMLQGNDNHVLYSLETNIKYDLDRTIETLKMIDQMYGQWHQKSFFDTLRLRLKYKVTADKVALVRIKGIGGVFASQLFEKGIKTVDDFVDQSNAVIIKSVIGNRYHESLEFAKQMRTA